MTTSGLPTIRVLYLIVAVGILFSGVATAKGDADPSGADQIGLVEQLYGTNITFRDYLEIVNPGKIEVMRQSLSHDAFEEFCSQQVYWGNDYPSLPYGATIWKETGPVNLSALNETGKRNYGIQNAIVGGKGYKILGYLNRNIKTREFVSFYRNIPSGLKDLSVDLNWIDTKSTLIITIFSPDGMMGPYDDASDGNVDGRIFLQVSRDRDLTGGDWYVVIEAEKTAGETQPFRLLFY